MAAASRLHRGATSHIRTAEALGAIRTRVASDTARVAQLRADAFDAFEHPDALHDDSG
jgi:hypothetical protein